MNFLPGSVNRTRFRLAALFVASALLPLAAVFAAETDSELALAIILTRHGVRAPLNTQQDFGKFTAEAWPQWDVPPGHITEHGREQMRLMGEYYRARYVSDGLLSGRPAQDAPLVYFRANNEQRTLGTARSIGTALLPGVQFKVHARAADIVDPLFRPAMVPVGAVDRAFGVSAVLGRVGGDPRSVQLAYRPALDTLERILVGEAGTVPTGKIALQDVPATVLPGEREHVVSLRGPVQVAGSMTDVLMLEYANGLPMSQVGWGRLTPERFTQLLAVHSEWFDLVHGTFYCAQVEGSNLASHLLATIDQAAEHRPIPGAIGSPNQKLVVVSGHDTNLISMGGLLGLTWWLPETQRNPVLLGGALVFELRQRKHDRQFFVRLLYIAPSLEQLRTLAPLSLEHPPGVAPIFIPGCSESSEGVDAPLPAFDALVRRVIDRRFVVESAE
jgi:4-phytase / acid phosphatase